MRDQAPAHRVRGRGWCRRALVAAAIWAACASATATSATAPVSAPTWREGLALQLWSFNADLKKDVPATLARIRALGFDKVETIRVEGYSPEQLRAALDTSGLRAVSAHIAYERIRDDLPGAIADAKALGVGQFGIPAIKIFGRGGYHELTIADAEEAGAVLTKACVAARTAGLRVFLHIHGNELKQLDGKTALDRIVEKAGGCFDIEVDIYWVMSAGLDPAAFIARYGSKVTSVHLKDWQPRAGAQLFFPPLGKGQIDLPAVLRASRAAGVRHYIIEDESGDAANQIPQSLAHLASFDD
jgi:sugar phosphate isomerase/epimerase